MSAPVFDLKISIRPGLQADLDAGFAKVQYAFSQCVARVTDPYVPFDTGTLKNSVNQASDFKGGLLVYNTPYARAQYYLHEQGAGLHGDSRLRGSYWGQRAIADRKDELETYAHNLAKQFLGGGR